MERESHISSIIVLVKPENIEQVCTKIAADNYAEIAALSKEHGKIIVVIDTATAKQAEQFIQKISSYQAVLSAGLVYHHVENNCSLDALVEINNEAVEVPIDKPLESF